MRIKNFKKKKNGEIDARSFNGGHKTNGARPISKDPLVTCRFSLHRSEVERIGSVKRAGEEAKSLLTQLYCL